MNTSLRTAFGFVARRQSIILHLLGLGMVIASSHGAFAQPAPEPSKGVVSDQDAPGDQSALEYPKDVQADELAGVVVDSVGQPLEGVLVDVWSWYPGNEATTDKNGAFRLKLDSERRKVEVRFMKEGYSPHYIPQQALGKKRLKIKLDSMTYLEGEVLGSDGKPVARAKVLAIQGPTQGDGVLITEVSTEVMTDENGRYRLYLFPNTYSVAVSSEKQGVVKVTGIQVGPKDKHELNLQCKPGITFRAKILDDDSHAPVAGAVLWHWRSPDLLGKSNANGEIEIANLLPGEQELYVGYGEPTKQGPFTIYHAIPYARWWSPDAKHMHQQRHIEKNGWQRNFDNLTFDLAVDMESVTIYLEKGVSVTGRVTDPDGNPVAKATVAPARTGSGNSLTGDTRFSVETNDDGTYEVCLPASGDAMYNLLAHDGAYSTWRKYAATVTEPMKTMPGQRIEHVDLRLHRPATVRGRVTNKAGKGVGGVEVRAHAHDKRGNRYYDPTTSTMPDGSFELSFIRPGNHYIQVEPFWLTAEDAPHSSTALVELKEGETKEGVSLVQEQVAR